MLFISPPFGNYFYLPHTMSIKGSYTLQPRNGLLFQIIKTFRYSFIHKGWVNKIGLRNKGLHYGITNYNSSKDIISIAILNVTEIPKILNILPDDTNIELNISCPNVNKSLAHDSLAGFVNKKRKWCIIKLSPLTDINLVKKYYHQGFRQFHCSNTLPIKEGGLSGSKVTPYSLALIATIKSTFNDVEIIAGGGIYDTKLITMYSKSGADHFSISTIFLHPIKFTNFIYSFYKNF